MTTSILINMNFQQLEYIIALDKHKSFSKASDSCFITQATLSTMVKRLEEELDVTFSDDSFYQLVEYTAVSLMRIKNKKFIITKNPESILDINKTHFVAAKQLFKSFLGEEINLDLETKIQFDIYNY